MGEISFKYMRKFEPVYETHFKYWFTNSKEYSFAYQRYIALSDTSIFNDPVAISKVATGFYNLHDLFVDKVIHPTIEQKNINVNMQKPVDIINLIISLYKKSYSTIMQQPMSILKRIGNDYLNIYDDDILLYRDKPELNIIKTFNMSTDKKEINQSFKNIIYANKDNIMQIYDYDVLLEKITGTKFNIYHDIYNLHRINRLNILKDDILCKRPTILINHYKNFLASDYINKLNILENLLAWTDDKQTNMLLDELGSKPNNITNIINNISCSPKYHININIITQLYANKIMPQSNINNDTLDIIVQNKHINLNDILSCSISNKISNIYKIYFSKSFNKNIDINYYLISSISEKKYSFKSNEVFGKNEIKDMFTSNQYHIIKHQNTLYKLDIDTFAITKEKYVFTTNNNFTVSDLKNIMIQSNIWTINNNKDVKVPYRLNFITKNDLNININNNCMFLFKYPKELFIVKSVFYDTNYKNLLLINDLFMNITSKNIFTDINDFMYKESINTDTYNQSIYINNIKKPIYNNKNTELFINRTEKSIWIDKNLFIDNTKKPLIEPDLDLYVNKNTYQISIYKNGFNITKNERVIYLQKDTSWIYKCKLDIPYHQQDIWSLKESFNLSLLNQLSVNKKNKDISIYQQSLYFLKNMISTKVEDMVPIIKEQIPADMLNEIAKNYAGMIIPVSKVKHYAFIDYIDKTMQKYIKDCYIDNSLFSSVLPKSIYYEDDMFFDKKKHKAFIDYKNKLITKSKIYTYMHNDISIIKNGKNAYVKPIISITKEESDAWVEDITTISKYFHNARLSQDEFVFSNFYESSILDSLFVDKTEQICYYDYGVFADKSEYRTMLYYNESVLKDNKSVHLADLISPFIKKNNKIFYDYEIFSSNSIKNMDLYKEIDSIDKTLKDIMIHPDDFGNWAWVYETPDPISPSYGIDELLLPENDTRYSDFEDIIFNKKTMKPRNPVKIINDTTFIAKYPHKHPIPKYSDVAVNYDDSAVKYEQYFGIKTEIMQKVFLKYYRIWQSKIFEFGTMTMTQSVEKMLEYLYAWIMIYFPPDELQQALRVFKLIRWYGESAIIQNSQYIISYEYDTLESKLTTGTCAIPNNLDPAINDSMFVDASLGVIKNNPIYANGSKEAYVEFYIDNRKNTSITFSLSNTVGSVNIYINNVLVDVISHSALNITYQIPYTGNVNVVKIEKPANHNRNQYFYIGNIKVPELSFKDLSIEFDATLKMGNKPLDEIAKKMIQYANLYDDFQDVYYKIKRNNLGIQETYKKMIEYWNLHHQDKTKGKRLTIKEV